MRVMMYVQHLLGIGHLQRASILARGMAAAGLNVCVALGGRDVPGISFDGCARIPLPSVYAADATFKVLLDENDHPIDDDWRDHRSARLAFEFDALNPDVLIIELFPFGRRMFAFELVPLLAQARSIFPVTPVICSLRDILVHKSDAERNHKAVQFANTWFDRVLIHGDPSLVGIEASFPEMQLLKDKLVYTGYVVDPDAAEDDPRFPPSEVGHNEVIVSVGGGAVGEGLLRTALHAKPHSRLASCIWRLITGPNLPEKTFAELAWSPPPGVIVERWRDDLPRLLRRCRVSVSQAGYNTVVELLRARARAVLVPFADAGETEQSTRARLLTERGLAVTVPKEELSPEALAGAIDQAAAITPGNILLDLNGVNRTIEIVRVLGEAKLRPENGGPFSSGVS